MQVLAVEFGQVAWEGIALGTSNVSASMAQDEGFGRRDARVVSGTLGGAAGHGAARYVHVVA